MEISSQETTPNGSFWIQVPHTNTTPVGLFPLPLLKEHNCMGSLLFFTLKFARDLLLDLQDTFHLDTQTIVFKSFEIYSESTVVNTSFRVSFIKQGI